MNSVEKPDGFDLRDRRSDRDRDARRWEPGDALYSASQVVPKDARCLAVVWMDAAGNIGFRYAGDHAGIVTTLTTALVHKTIG